MFSHTTRPIIAMGRDYRQNSTHLYTEYLQLHNTTSLQCVGVSGVQCTKLSS